MASTLMVFISSVMDKEVDDLERERAEAEAAITALSLTTSWRFESAPASSQPVDRAYLNKVEDCDLFLLILGRGITIPVQREYNEAVLNNKKILVFVKNDERERSPEFEEFLRGIKFKYRYFNPGEFRNLVGESVAEAIIETYQAVERYPSKVSDDDVMKLEGIKFHTFTNRILSANAVATFQPIGNAAPRSPIELIKERAAGDRVLPLMAEIPKLNSISDQIEFVRRMRYADIYADSWADIEVQLIGFDLLKKMTKRIGKTYRSMYDAGCANCGQYKALMSLGGQRPYIADHFQYFGQDFNEDWKRRFNVRIGEFFSMPLPFVEDRKVDLVACTHVLHFFEKNPIAIYASLFSFNRLLDEGGHCYITVPLKDAQLGMRDVLERSARDAGFTILESEQCRLTHELTTERASNVTTFTWLLLQKRTEIDSARREALLGVSFLRWGEMELAGRYGIQKEADIPEDLGVLEEDIRELLGERNPDLRTFGRAIDMVYEDFFTCGKNDQITTDRCHDEIVRCIHEIDDCLRSKEVRSGSGTRLETLCGHYLFWIAAWYLSNARSPNREAIKQAYAVVETSLKNTEDVRIQINDLRPEQVARLVRHLVELCRYEEIDLRESFMSSYGTLGIRQHEANQ